MNIIIRSLIIAAVICAVVYAIMFIISIMIHVIYCVHMYNTLSEEEYDEFSNWTVEQRAEKIEEWLRSK